MILYIYILVQVILESLPVSSSGHIALLDRIVKAYDISLSFVYTWIFDFLLHGPTVVIVMIYFFNQWWSMVIKESFSLQVFLKKSFWLKVIPALLFVGIADGITFVWWWLHITPQVSLTIGFMITAVLLCSTRYVKGTQKCTWSLWHAVVLGFAQAFSLMPGVSRFATTYTVGTFLGYESTEAFAVSFLIQVPLILGACIKGLIALHENSEIMQNLFDFRLLFVILSASLLSYVALSVIGTCIKKGNIWKLYRYMVLPIVLSIVL